MAQHYVKVVDDETLATGDGWALARCEDTGDLVFVIERSAAQSEAVLHTAWTAAAQLVIEEAVRHGHVAWTPEAEKRGDSTAERLAPPRGDVSGGRRVDL